MSAQWLTQLPALVAAAGLLVFPGLPTAFLLRLRGVTLVGGSMAGSLAIVGAASLVAPVLGIRWSLLPVVLVAVVVTLVAALLRYPDRNLARDVRGADDRRVWIGVGASALGWILILTLGIRNPSHPTQLYDGLFHLNAVEFILRNGDASPFHMTMVVPGSDTHFYPTLWHALVALVEPLSGAVVPATNVLTLAVVAVMWPIALAVLASVLFPSNPSAATWTPVLGFGFSVFPVGFLNWGVLYPNLLGTLQIPFLIAFVLLASRGKMRGAQRTGLVLLAVASAAACALAHPSALLAAAALLVPYAASCAWRAWRAGGRRTRSALIVGAVVAASGVVVIWNRANVTTHEWLPDLTLAQAVGEVALLSPVGRATGLLVGLLAAIGMWTVIRSRRWWILGAHAIAAGFYLAAAWLPVLPIRSAIVGVWYDDATRVGALLGIIGLPLAGLGASVAVDWFGRLRREGHSRRLSMLIVLVLVLVVVVCAATHLNAVRNDISFMRNVSFRFDAMSQGLTPDEVGILKEADEILEQDSLVVGDPLTGAALLFAYTGHDVVFPHVSGNYGPDAELLARSLNADSPDVCGAIRRLGVTYALDFGDKELFENHFTRFDGLHGLQSSSILTEVARSGDAALFKVTGCL